MKSYKVIINSKNDKKTIKKSDLCITREDIHLVNITDKQYNSLVEKYGYEVTIVAMKMLDAWFESGSKYAKKYIGKNNYGHFRSDGWIICDAKRIFGLT